MKSYPSLFLLVISLASASAGAKPVTLKDFQMKTCSKENHCIEIKSSAATMSSLQTLLTMKNVTVSFYGQNNQESLSFDSGYVDLSNQKALFRTMDKKSIFETEYNLVNLETRKFTVPL